jgi:hypothetical protein
MIHPCGNGGGGRLSFTAEATASATAEMSKVSVMGAFHCLPTGRLGPTVHSTCTVRRPLGLVALYRSLLLAVFDLVCCVKLSPDQDKE